MKKYIRCNNEELDLSDDEIKDMFSTEILKFSDKAAESVLRRVLFGHGSNIDWQRAYDIAIYFMPELKLYKKN